MNENAKTDVSAAQDSEKALTWERLVERSIAGY